MGLLRVVGTIDTAQFWPNGESDADTTKVKVDVDRNSFAFAADGVNFRPTRAFEGARVRGRSSDPVIKNGRITVRLQGIDAPELHYKASALPSSSAVSPEQRRAFNDANRRQRRQHWAESATQALADRLRNFGGETLRCEVLSAVDYPYELVDTYGRVVANIRVGPDASTDINIWLTEAGWVVPTFYSSMSEDEIRGLLSAAAEGERQGRVAGAVDERLNRFDETLIYRRAAPAGSEDDSGPLIMPKLFRRQVSYELQKAVGIASGTFKAFLAASPDHCFELEDFLTTGVHSATPRRLDEFVRGNRFPFTPGGIVFKEKFSSVVDENNRRLEEF